MKLADVLAAGKAGLKLEKDPSLCKPVSSISSSLDEDLFILTERKEDSTVGYHLYDSSKYPEPNYDLFLAAWTPYLRNPYSFRAMTFRPYLKWILSPSLYVLNTFSLIDTYEILQVILQQMPPSSPEELHYLSQFLFEIRLTVPAKYERDFLRLLRKNFS